MTPPPPHHPKGDIIPPPPYQDDAKTSYVYLLRSRQNGKFYVGWTTGLKRRLDEHNRSKCYYTKSRGPWDLIYYEVYSSIQEAKKRERTLKNNSRMMFLFKKRGLIGQSQGMPREVDGMTPPPPYHPKGDIIPPPQGGGGIKNSPALRDEEVVG